MNRETSLPPNPSASLLSLLFRVIVGSVLIYSGASKAIGPTAEFSAALAAYRLLPLDWISIVAVVWPWLELLVGTYLLFGYYTQLSATAATGLFAIFLTVLITSMARGIDPGSCGCFGVGITLSIHQTAMLDSILFILSIVLINLSKTPSPYSVDAWIAVPQNNPTRSKLR